MNKVALITGAYKGIGFETAFQLGKKGYTVLVTARTQQKSEDAAAKLKAESIDAWGLKLDVNNSEDVTNVVTFLSEDSGGLTC